MIRQWRGRNAAPREKHCPRMRRPLKLGIFNNRTRGLAVILESA
jgi:hypothetical protein